MCSVWICMYVCIWVCSCAVCAHMYILHTCKFILCSCVCICTYICMLFIIVDNVLCMYLCVWIVCRKGHEWNYYLSYVQWYPIRLYHCTPNAHFAVSWCWSEGRNHGGHKRVSQDRWRRSIYGCRGALRLPSTAVCSRHLQWNVSCAFHLLYDM